VLAPLVEGAGYEVVYPEDAAAKAADLVIMADGTEAARGGEAATVVRLRRNADQGAASPDSLWRYDRAGLTAELRRHWNKRG
jgi:two-component system chemotaxis sensor kinase CheA